MNTTPSPPEAPGQASAIAGLAAIVLAAGRSSRFEGAHKLTQALDGRALVGRVLDQVAAGPAGDIVVVVGERAEAVRAAAGQGRWRFTLNALAAGGLSTSIRAGIAALAPGTQAAMIVLADMPSITTPLICALAEAARANPGAIIHPVTPDGRQGHPVLWPADLFGALRALTGDKGAKGLLETHKARIVTLRWDDAGITRDIDTRQDLAAFLKTKN